MIAAHRLVILVYIISLFGTLKGHLLSLIHDNKPPDAVIHYLKTCTNIQGSSLLFFCYNSTGIPDPSLFGVQNICDNPNKVSFNWSCSFLLHFLGFFLKNLKMRVISRSWQSHIYSAKKPFRAIKYFDFPHFDFFAKSHFNSISAA